MTQTQVDSRLAALGVKVVNVQGAKYGLVKVAYQNEQESGGQHNIYFIVLDEQGNPLGGIVGYMDWTGRAEGDKPTRVVSATKAPANLNGVANAPMYANLDITKLNGPYFAYLENQQASDYVTGMGLPEHHHVNFILTWQRGAVITPEPGGNVEIKSVKLEPTTLGADDQYGVLLKVTMVVYNGTSTALQTQEPAPGKTYKEGETFQSVGFPESKGKYRVGLDYEGNTGIDHPYRWGLGEPLQPGATVTIDGFVELKKKSKKDYWAGLVEEQVRWVQDNIGRITVTVTESPARYKLHITCKGNGGVVVSPYADDYAAGTEVTLGATPFGSARFVEWTGGITTNPLTLTMDSDVDITATFAEDAPQSEIEQRVAALEQGLANMVTELSGYHERADLLDSAIAELKTFKANIKAA